ncbi:MAG: universal stress protein [Candidatus Bathyarchaeota archaeon]|nr:universal stress protein [Candidatus Bathyarchaeota archaeon]
MQEKIRVVVGVDGSVQSRRALAEAVTIAQRFSGFVKAVSVYDKGSRDKAKDILDKAENALLINAGIHYETQPILGSNPAKALELLAKQENFDLIVVGRRGIGGGVSLLMGSVSKQIVSNAYCNVLVVKNR